MAAGAAAAGGVMGLFGSSPQKKLEKAREHFAAGRWFDAMRFFEEVVEAGGKVGEGERSEARQGFRLCRERMIRLRLEESEALRLAGDLEGARDRCQTAVDLAGDDLDAPAVHEQLRRIDAPSRAVAAGPEVGEMHETDLLPGANRRVVLSATPVDRPPREAVPRDDAELFGDNPEELFDVHLHALSEPVADYLRALGPDFRFGYLALVQGEGKRALDFFDRLDWTAIHHPAALRQRANALLLARRADEALEQIDAMAPAGDAGRRSAMAGDAGGPAATAARDPVLAPDEPDGEARRRYLRIDALRVLGRLEEAVQDAQLLADAAAAVEPMPTLEAMLGWVLIEAGRTQEAFDRLSRRLRDIGYHEEILIPAAQAAVALGRDDEAVELLEQLIHSRMERGLAQHMEIEFPVEAGRRLLDIHLRRGAEERTLRTLILHLIDHDVEEGERYRDLLMQLDRRAEVGEKEEKES
jgi:tetratricopeptide (TPR) repeat protein